MVYETDNENNVTASTTIATASNNNNACEYDNVSVSKAELIIIPIRKLLGDAFIFFAILSKEDNYVTICLLPGTINPFQKGAHFQRKDFAP